ncbi:hypothetical protein C8J57DRAFT_1238235 [Mycena rebaudengoi]|nr:hypothetical protein C8J57DRAFT_1238235 [Mycena rebaudengoi]
MVYADVDYNMFTLPRLYCVSHRKKGTKECGGSYKERAAVTNPWERNSAALNARPLKVLRLFQRDAAFDVPPPSTLLAIPAVKAWAILWLWNGNNCSKLELPPVAVTATAVDSTAIPRQRAVEQWPVARVRGILTGRDGQRHGRNGLLTGPRVENILFEAFYAQNYGNCGDGAKTLYCEDWREQNI